MRGPSYWVHRLAKGMHDLSSTPPMSLGNYEDAVRFIENNNVNRRFLNNTYEHVRLVVELMIGRMMDGDEVLIYTSTLPAFYEVALRNPKCKLRILVDNIHGMNAVRILRSEVSCRIDCRFVSAPEGKYFMSGGSAYRMVVDNDNEFIAVSNFNEPEAVQRLRSRFDRMWECAVSHLESSL